MTEQSFSLIPFPKSSSPAIQINGHVSRQNGRLTVHYLLTGEIERIFVPARSPSPRRKNGLWAGTCFEIFLARPAEPRYWEFNISPSGDWNVYYMDAYRRIGFREETSIQRLPWRLENDASYISLHADVDLSRLISNTDRIQLGISCVIKSVDRHETYWALSHPNEMPDFHVRESFRIQL